MTQEPTNCLCPGCEGDTTTIPDPALFTDSDGRQWHWKCAKRALANGFRTPLPPEDATYAVRFAHRGESWIAPHSLHLHELILPEGAELRGLFVGQTAAVYALQASIRANDMPRRAVPIDMDVPKSMSVTVQVFPPDAVYELIGERRPENARPRDRSPFFLGVGALHVKAVAPGGTATCQFAMPALFRGERVVCDDWHDWEVVDVRLGVDPGRSTLDGNTVPLSGHSTDMPAYEARIAEPIVYEVRNRAAVRDFDARVYGTLRK